MPLNVKSAHGTTNGGRKTMLATAFDYPFLSPARA
jgi:hypothetical protein